MSSLTPEQIGLFRQIGFTKLPERLPKDLVAKLNRKILEDIDDEVEPVYRNSLGRVVRVSNIWDRDPVFREALASPQVLDSLETLLGPNIEYIKNKHNHATIRTADSDMVYFHRDTSQWSRNVVSVIFYLEDTTVENGCTYVVPGTNLMQSDGEHSVEGQEDIIKSGLLDQALPVPMPAGGMLALDSMTIHGASENSTENTRISMTAGYHSVDDILGLENPKRVLVRGEDVYKGNDRLPDYYPKEIIPFKVA